MEPVDIKFSSQMRDPMGDAGRFVEYYSLEFEMLNDSDLNRWQAGAVIESIKKRGVAMYSRGDAVSSLVGRLEDDFPCLQAQSNRALHEEFEGRSDRDRAMYGPILTRNRLDFGYVALALLLLRDSPTVSGLLRLHTKRPEQRLYGVDLLLKAFDPDWSLAKKYVRDRSPWSADRWGDAVVRVMAAPPDQRSAALDRHMSSWGSLMKPLGWKAVRDFSPEAAEKRGELESLFVDFAFEAALAVCAYDIDDSSFRDHPYYPGDLVEHYRAHVRHTRDAWRGEGVGAGVPIEAPPPPQRANLAKSKRKGLARWLELASDGDGDAVEAVIEEHGNPRKISDLGALSGVMAEQGIGVHVDLKDDDTLLSQLDSLAQARSLGEFEAPGSPVGTPAVGPGRCEYLLQASAVWFQSRGYRLLALDVDDDAWSAALVRADYADELQTLGERLGINTSELKED